MTAFHAMDLVGNHSCSSDVSLHSPHLRKLENEIDDSELGSILAALTGFLPPTSPDVSVANRDPEGPNT